MDQLRKNKSLNYDAPLCLYDTVNKKIMGIFKSAKLVYMYLWVDTKEKNYYRNSISYAILHKGKITDSRFGFPVAIRLGGLEKKELLSELDAILYRPYEAPGWFDVYEIYTANEL